CRGASLWGTGSGALGRALPAGPGCRENNLLSRGARQHWRVLRWTAALPKRDVLPRLGRVLLAGQQPLPRPISLQTVVSNKLPAHNPRFFEARPSAYLAAFLLGGPRQ